jgi:hypothetical protein
MKTDFFRSSLFQPSPGTKIFTMMKERGFIKDGEETSYMPNAIFQDTPHVAGIPREIVNLQKLFFLFVKYPKLEPLLKPLLKTKPGSLHWAIFFLTYGYSIFGFRNMTLPQIAKVAYQEVTLFLRR